MVFSLSFHIMLRREKQDNQTRASSNPLVNLSLDERYRTRGQEEWVRLIFPNRVLGCFCALGRLDEGKPKRCTPRRLFGGKGALRFAFSGEKASWAPPFIFLFCGERRGCFCLTWKRAEGLGRTVRFAGRSCGGPAERCGRTARLALLAVIERHQQWGFRANPATHSDAKA